MEIKKINPEKIKELFQGGVKKIQKPLDNALKDLVSPVQMAVDFGNKNIKIVYGNFNKKKIELFEYDIIPTPEGLISDGKIIDVIGVAKLLREAIERSELNPRKMMLLLSGSGIIIREIQIPKTDEREIEHIIEFEAQQYFPIELSQYMVDYKILEESITEEGEKYRIFLVAVPLEQIGSYVNLSETLNIDLKSIDLVMNASLKYLLGREYLKEEHKSRIKREKQMENLEEGRFKEVDVETSMFEEKVVEGEDENSTVIEVREVKPEKNYAILDMGAETTTIYIYCNDRLKFNRTLLTGNSELDRQVSYDLKMEYSDAERAKIEKGNLNTDDETRELFEESEKINKSLVYALGNIMDDAGRFLEFYNSRSSDGTIEKIYIYGGGSNVRGMREYLINFFNIPVEYLGDSLYPVEYSQNQEQYEKDKRILVNAVGGLIG